MTERVQRLARDAFPVFRSITTRWMDNDVYGHVNNVQYYAFFDSAVNGWLIERGLLDVKRSDTVGLVVETGCTYFASVAFPDVIEAGIRVTKLGRSSVRYEVGIFRSAAAEAAAQGHFVHVYVDRASQRPVEIPPATREALSALLPSAR